MTRYGWIKQEQQTKVMFAQIRQGYRPGKRSVWNDDLEHYCPGPESSERERTTYAQWLEVVAGTRVHTDDTERRSIVDRMLAAEFKFSPHTVRPLTPPDQWEAFLGESLPAKYLAQAEQAWNQEAS